MGAACGKSSGDATKSSPSGTLEVMFHRFDKEKKGYISRKNLQEMMKDDKTHFHGKDADHIMNKYGENGKMNMEQFEAWWNSTYTTYDAGHIEDLVDEVDMEHMKEIEELKIPEDQHLSTKVVTRS